MPERGAPTILVDQPGDEWHKDHACQPTAQGQHSQRLAALTHKPGGGYSKGRFVEDHGSDDANRTPEQVETKQRLNLCPGNNGQDRQARAKGHQPACAVPIQPVADRHGSNARDKQHQRKRAGHFGLGPAHLQLGGGEQHTKAVEKNAPRDRLSDRQGTDDDPAIVKFRAGRRRHDDTPPALFANFSHSRNWLRLGRAAR